MIRVSGIFLLFLTYITINGWASNERLTTWVQNREDSISKAVETSLSEIEEPEDELEEVRNGLKIKFVETKERQAVTKNYFNSLRVENISSASIQFTTKLELPQFWYPISNNLETSIQKIDSGEVVFLPFYIGIPRNVPVSGQFKIGVQLMDATRTSTLNEISTSFYVSETTEWEINVVEEELYMFSESEEYTFTVNVRNSSSTAKDFQLRLPLKKIVRVPGNFRETYEMAFRLNAVSDTSIYIPLIIQDQKLISYGVSPVLSVEVTDGARKENDEINLVFQNNLYQYSNAGSVYYNNFELGVRNIRDGSLASVYFMGNGNEEISKDNRFSYYVNYQNLGFEELDGEVYYNFNYKWKNRTAGVGIASTKLTPYLFSRNSAYADVDLPAGNRGRVLIFGSKELEYDDGYGAAGGYEFTSRNATIQTGVSSVKTNEGYEEYNSFRSEGLLQDNKRNHTVTYLGEVLQYDRSFYGPNQKDGHMFSMSYFGIVKPKLTTWLSMKYASKDYYGFLSGTESVENRVKWQINNEFTLHSEFFWGERDVPDNLDNPSLSVTGFSAKNIFGTIGLEYRMKGNYRFQLGPFLERYEISELRSGLLGEDINEKYGLQLQFNKPFSQSILRANFKASLRDLNIYSGGVLSETKKGEDYFAEVNYTYRKGYTSLVYNKGSVNAFRLSRRLDDFVQDRFVLNSNQRFEFFSNRLKVNAGAYLAGDFNYENASLGILAGAEFDITPHWRFKLWGNTSHYHYFNEDLSEVRHNYVVHTGLRYLFNVVPKNRNKQLLDLKVHFFFDDNGNGVKDKKEDGVPFVSGTLNQDESSATTGQLVPAINLVSKLDGTIAYRNVPAGNYKILLNQLGKSKEFIFGEGIGPEYTVQLTKNRTIEIPMVRMLKVDGTIELTQAAHSVYRTSTSGIRVTLTNEDGVKFTTLTDENGEYSLAVPTRGKYKIHLNNVFRRFYNITNNDSIIDVGEYNTNYNFQVKEKEREVLSLDQGEAYEIDSLLQDLASHKDTLEVENASGVYYVVIGAYKELANTLRQAQRFDAFYQYFGEKKTYYVYTFRDPEWEKAFQEYVRLEKQGLDSWIYRSEKTTATGNKAKKANEAYYVVIGSFRKLTNAKKYARQYNVDYKYFENEKLYRVYTAKSGTILSALSEYKRLKKTVPDVWIYVYDDVVLSGTDLLNTGGEEKISPAFDQSGSDQPTISPSDSIQPSNANQTNDD